MIRMKKPIKPTIHTPFTRCFIKYFPQITKYLKFGMHRRVNKNPTTKIYASVVMFESMN